MASDTGSPLIVHVCQAAAAATTIDRVIVAAGESEIVDAVESAGFEAVLTRSDHPNGTSRVAEVAAGLGLPSDAILVNVQGDEPEIEPEVIDAGVRAIMGSDAPVATIATPFLPDQDASDPNMVKVLLDQTGHALAFTRALVPHDRDGVGGIARYRHVGLYIYRAWFLRRVTDLTPTPLETAEKLEQLRFLEHGYRIAVAIERAAGAGIDTAEQYNAFVKRWKNAHGEQRS